MEWFSETVELVAAKIDQTPDGGTRPQPILDTWKVLAELYRLDVFGTRAFRTLAFRVGHLLAFTQFLESDALEAR